MAAIQCDNLSKRYRVGKRTSLREAIASLSRRLTGRSGDGGATGDFIWALRDVNFSVERGETLGIIGRNGAGKTTILKLLSNITYPTRGMLEVNGRASALIELGAGFHPDLTGRENVYLNALILGLERHQIDERLDDIIAFAELESFIDTPVKRYSSGMYARLGFSVAAHVDPDVLLVDEVLSVGDIMFQRRCLNRIHDFQAAGKCIVFVSHNLVSVQKVCSRVIWLDGGRIREVGDPQTVVNAYMHHQLREKPDAASFKPGEIPLRYGTGEAEIERVTIVDGGGQARDAFDCGEPICVQIAYRASKRVAPVNFFVIVTTGDGFKLCGTDFYKTGYQGLASIEQEGQVRCDLRSLPLRPGVYFLIVGLEGEGRVMDRKGMIGPFTIRPNTQDMYCPPGRYGLVDVESAWSADGVGGEA